jgi:hypothetical protein
MPAVHERRRDGRGMSARIRRRNNDGRGMRARVRRRNNDAPRYDRAAGSWWSHWASARSPVPSSTAGVATCGLSRRYHSASSAA